MRRLQGNNVLVRIGWKPDIREQNLLLSLFDCRWCYNTRAIIQAHSRMKLKSAQLYTKCKIFLSMRVLWFLVPQGHTYLSCWLCQGESVVSIIIQSSSVILSTLEPMGSTTNDSTPFSSSPRFNLKRIALTQPVSLLLVSWPRFTNPSFCMKRCKRMLTTSWGDRFSGSIEGNNSLTSIMAMEVE